MNLRNSNFDLCVLIFLPHPFEVLFRTLKFLYCCDVKARDAFQYMFEEWKCDVRCNFQYSIVLMKLIFLQEKIERNASALETHTHHLCRLAESRRDALKINQTENTITFSIKRGVFVHDGLESSSLEKESTNFQEELASSGTLVGHSRNGKSIITLVKLPFIEKIPPYTTWIFLDRFVGHLFIIYLTWLVEDTIKITPEVATKDHCFQKQKSNDG